MAKNQYTVIYFEDGYGNSELKWKIEQEVVSFISGMLKNFRKSNGIYLIFNNYILYIYKIVIIGHSSSYPLSLSFVMNQKVQNGNPNKSTISLLHRDCLKSCIDKAMISFNFTQT